MALRLVLSNKPEDTFPTVWQPYPRKESKKDALKAWCQLDPDEALIANILTALAWQVELWEQRSDWYTPPLLATYLRAERWTDEPPKSLREEKRQQGRAWIQQVMADREKPS